MIGGDQVSLKFIALKFQVSSYTIAVVGLCDSSTRIRVKNRRMVSKMMVIREYGKHKWNEWVTTDKQSQCLG